MTYVASKVITSVRTTEALRARQAQARYPQLLAEAPAQANGVIYRRIRGGTGLVITAVRHDALTPEQAAALAEFRLQQYVLCGWYDLDALDRHDALSDPAFEHLPWNTIHVLAGTSSGCLLAYFCMQPASLVSTTRNETSVLDNESHRQPVMGDGCRPLFPTEIHSFSPHVFSSLPALRGVPVQRVRELTRLLRNQTTHSLLSAIAVVEAVCAMTSVAMDPESAISVMLGCVDREARHVTAHLGIPILYAPLAQTIPVPTQMHEFYWADRANEQGRFWPFVIATDDLRPFARWFAQIDELLGGAPHDVRRGIVALRRRTHPPQSLSLAQRLESSPVFWTPNILFEAREIAPPETLPLVAPDAMPAPISTAATTATGGKVSRSRRRRSSKKRVTATSQRRTRRSRRRSKRRSRGTSARRGATRASRRMRR